MNIAFHVTTDHDDNDDDEYCLSRDDNNLAFFSEGYLLYQRAGRAGKVGFNSVPMLIN